MNQKQNLKSKKYQNQQNSTQQKSHNLSAHIKD